MRFETEPGLQAQVDWKYFGRQLLDGRQTRLHAFVMVLGYSRKAFVRFTTRMDSAAQPEAPSEAPMRLRAVMRSCADVFDAFLRGRSLQKALDAVNSVLYSVQQRSSRV